MARILMQGAKPLRDACRPSWLYSELLCCPCGCVFQHERTDESFEVWDRYGFKSEDQELVGYRVTCPQCNRDIIEPVKR